MIDYRRELRMEADIRRKRKVEKTTEFMERMKKAQKEIKATLRKIQVEMKRQVNKRQRETEKSKKVILSTKYLIFKERIARKLME